MTPADDDDRVFDLAHREWQATRRREFWQQVRDSLPPAELYVVVGLTVAVIIALWAALVIR